MYACLYSPPDHAPAGDRAAGPISLDPNSAISALNPASAGLASGSPSAISAPEPLLAIAREFSPRFESGGDTVTIDVQGLDRLLGDARTIGDELRREAASRGVRAHVALATTQTAARLLAITTPGLTVIAPGEEGRTIAPLAIGILERFTRDRDPDSRSERRERRNRKDSARAEASAIAAFRQWGLKTLGEVAALPPADLASRLGAAGLRWQAMARGDDVRPLVPDAVEERFESAMDLEWPIEGLEPLSFVLTRLLEPLSIRLERRDRGVAVLHVQLDQVDGVCHARRLQLPSPIRDVRTLRTLALLDLESHPPAAAIDRVTLVIDPTPGRVVQHTLFARPQLTPEQLSTLLARLGAVMGQDRVGAPATVDSYRPGAFEMKAFAGGQAPAAPGTAAGSRQASPGLQPLVPVLRRCRHPVPARVASDAASRPVRVTTDRRGFAGGAVVRASGPWRTSGEWWNAGTAGRAATAGGAGWDRDEWDVTLNDGGSYRVFRDRATGGWFIDAICD
jgi:protein ImuB